jgi:peroxin-6
MLITRRFDRMLYLGLSDTHDAQLQLLQALTRKFRLHPDLDLRAVAEQCPLNLTGADFYALCADAMLKAMVGKIQHIDDVVGTAKSPVWVRIPTHRVSSEAWNAQPHSAHGDHPHPLTARYYLSELASLKDMEVQVTQDNFILALQDLVPSVSVAELEHYHRIQGQYSNN